MEQETLMDPQIALQRANGRIAELHDQAVQEGLARLARKTAMRAWAPSYAIPSRNRIATEHLGLTKRPAGTFQLTQEPE
jgi:hypothetical protein